MLSIIYRNKPNWTVCKDNGISKNALIKLIQNHERIIMLGHGTPFGLINSARNGYLIDDSYADLLRTKECVSIWCYSDQYFRRNNIKGFHTGMIISEVAEEAYVLGYIPLQVNEIYSNMIKFSKCVEECIDLSPNEMKQHILNTYVGDDPVTTFNRKNIIVL